MQHLIFLIPLFAYAVTGLAFYRLFCFLNHLECELAKRETERQILEDIKDFGVFFSVLLSIFWPIFALVNLFFPIYKKDNE